MSFNPYTGVIRDVASGEIDAGQHDTPREVQACSGFAFLVRREVFARVGLFDENFNPYGWEDVDISLRAAKDGFRVVYEPKAVVYHLGGRAGRGTVEVYERHKARSLLYFIRQHTTRWQRLCCWCVLPLRAVARVAKEIAKGNVRVVHAWLGAITRRV